VPISFGRSKSGHKNSRSLENVSQIKYLGMTVTNENLIQEKIKRRLNSGDPEPSIFSSAVEKRKN
jgi:hypothetical protein